MLILPFPCIIDSAFLLRLFKDICSEITLIPYYFISIVIYHCFVRCFHFAFYLKKRCSITDFLLVVIAHTEPGITNYLQASPFLSEGLFDHNEVFFNYLYLISNGLKEQEPYSIKQLSQTHRPEPAYRTSQCGLNIVTWICFVSSIVSSIFSFASVQLKQDLQM